MKASENPVSLHIFVSVCISIHAHVYINSSIHIYAYKASPLVLKHPCGVNNRWLQVTLIALVPSCIIFTQAL